MSTSMCGEHAAFRFTWAGREESFACVDHALQLSSVAGAMGYPLQLIPLTYRANDPVPEEFPTCRQQVPERADETLGVCVISEGES